MSSQGEGPDDLMTGVDAARILGLSVDMVRVLAKEGRLPFMSTVRGIRLFRRADVEHLARERRARTARSVDGESATPKMAVVVDSGGRAKSRGRPDSEF